MADEVFERALDELSATASMIDLRGWGESTLLRSFGIRARRAALGGARLRLVTNGLAMTEEYWRLILQTDGVVALSVDAANERTWQLLGRGDMQRVIRNLAVGIDVLREIEYGTIYFNTVVSAVNVDELEEIVRLAARSGVHRVVFQPVKVPQGSELSLEAEVKRLRKSLVNAAEAGRDYGVTCLAGASLHPELVDSEFLPTACSNPWSHVVVSYDGELIFCDHLIGHADHSVGNIMSAPFESIWNGWAMARLRLAHVEAERSRDVGRFKKCTWCYANRYGETEAAPCGASDRTYDLPV
jgi:radical SAM protein with 4Fe4S-binding SPASM domain